MRKTLFCLLALVSTSAFSMDEGVFDLEVFVNGNAGDIIGMMNGWSCSSSTSNRYQEKLADHNGEVKFIDRNIKTESSSLWDDDIQSEFRKDMSLSSKILTQVTESCSRTNSTPSTSCDGDGNCTTIMTSDTEHLNFTWNCEFTKFPTGIGQSVKTKCDPEKSSFGSASYFDITRLVKEKEISARLTLKERHESFAVDLCKGRNLANRKIIKLTQGLDGLAMEDDFVVTIEIPGLTKPIKLFRNSNTFNDEIAICRTGDIKLKVTAVEVDPVWDDIYSCEDRSNEIVLSTKVKGKNVATIDYKRDNTWDKLFLDKKQQLKFEIIEAPVH